MPDLNYEVVGAEPERFAASPSLLFKLRVSERLAPGAPPTPIHSVVLRAQVRIEPARRSYTATERTRLRDLFGTPDRWGQTLRSMLWAHVVVSVGSFEGTGTEDLPVACGYDLSLAATKYFDALEGGDLPLAFLFSGTIFYQAEDGALQVAQVPWDREAEYRLPATTWRALIDRYYPNTAWLCLRKDVFDRLDQYRSQQGLPTSEQALERLLASSEEPVTP